MLVRNSEFLGGRCAPPESKAPRSDSCEAPLEVARESVCGTSPGPTAQLSNRRGARLEVHRVACGTQNTILRAGFRAACAVRASSPLAGSRERLRR